MKEISIYTKKILREHKMANVLPIWRVLPIKKCWIGLPTVQYVIWMGNTVLDHCDTYKGAIKRRREIWNEA